MTLSRPMYWKPAVPRKPRVVLAEVATNDMLHGVHVDDVLVVKTLHVWLWPAALA